MAAIDHVDIDPTELASITNRLARSGYAPHERADHLLVHETAEYAITVNVRPHRIDFWAADTPRWAEESPPVEAIFEILQTAAELTDSGLVRCYDPQNLEWTT